MCVRSWQQQATCFNHWCLTLWKSQCWIEKKLKRRPKGCYSILNLSPRFTWTDVNRNDGVEGNVDVAEADKLAKKGKLKPLKGKWMKWPCYFVLSNLFKTPTQHKNPELWGLDFFPHKCTGVVFLLTPRMQAFPKNKQHARALRTVSSFVVNLAQLSETRRLHKLISHIWTLLRLPAQTDVKKLINQTCPYVKKKTTSLKQTFLEHKTIIYIAWFRPFITSFNTKSTNKFWNRPATCSYSDGRVPSEQCDLVQLQN